MIRPPYAGVPTSTCRMSMDLLPRKSKIEKATAGRRQNQTGRGPRRAYEPSRRFTGDLLRWYTASTTDVLAAIFASCLCTADQSSPP